MPKRSMEEVFQKFDEIQNKLLAGKNHFNDLMTKGVKVKHPQTGEEVTFNNLADSNKFLGDLRKEDKTYPLTEIARGDNAPYHMYMFLYSKGITPDEIASVLENPGVNVELENKIKGLRDDYFKMALSKDADAISDMYVKAFDVLSKQNVGWLKGAHKFDKFMDSAFKIDVLSGSHSSWVQTNNLGGQMRPIDVDIVSKTQKKAFDKNIDIASVVTGAQIINFLNTKIKNPFIGKNENTGMYQVASIAAQFTRTITEDETLGSISDDKNIPGEQSMNLNSNFFETVSPNIGQNQESMDAYYDALTSNDEDDILPHMIYEISFHEFDINGIGEQTAFFGDERNNAINNPNHWIKWNTENYDDSKNMMDPYSVLHAINLIKEGTFDGIINIPGEGQKMLDVMHGQYDKFDELSSFSKAVVVSKMYIDHPGLLMGSVDRMMKEADRLHLDIDNPVYSQLITRRRTHVVKNTQEKIDKLVDKLAEKKLSKSVNEATLDEKKKFAKTLLLMQTGGAVDKDISKNPKDFSMMNLLAGGHVDIILPEMSKNEKNNLKTLVPSGKSLVTAGINQDVSYKKNILKIDFAGTRGNADEIKASTVDLRGFDPEVLNKMLTGFDAKVSGMNEEEINNLINRLNTPDMSREELSVMINGFGNNLQVDGNNFEEPMIMAANYIVPPAVLDADDFMMVDKIYSYEIEGERKYPGLPEEIANINLDLVDTVIEKSAIDANKDFVSKTKEYYLNLKTQVSVYADAAEKMHRIIEENEKSDNPSPNVSNFAKIKEKEFAEKYREGMEKIKSVAESLNWTIAKDKTDKNKIYEPTSWIDKDLADMSFSKDLRANYNKPSLTRDELAASLMNQFEGIGFETSAEKTGEKLAVHKWKFMGITFSNNETYDDIVNSMNELKQMRENNLNEENVREYKEEYNHLRDLCAQYIVSHRRNPWTDDGKERLKMVKTVWESMSNADENVLDAALQIEGQGQKISNVNIHKNDRRKVSYDELLNENNDRKERIREHKARKVQKNAERQNNGPDRGGMA